MGLTSMHLTVMAMQRKPHAILMVMVSMILLVVVTAMIQMRIVPTDVDGDGVSVCAGDCDDNDATVFLGTRSLLGLPRQ